MLCGWRTIYVYESISVGFFLGSEINKFTYIRFLPNISDTGPQLGQVFKQCFPNPQSTIRGKILSCPSVLICCTVRVSGVAYTVAGLAKTKR